jgi:hypothetical protein
MLSVCLENLETLNKKGVDREIIYNTVGNVYAGRLGFVIVGPQASDRPTAMSDTVRVVVTSASRLFSPPS